MKDNILIRTPNHLGDCIMSLPMINQVHEAYPDSRVTVLTPQYLAELFEGNQSVEQILGIPREHVHGLIGVKKTVDILAGHDFDIGYILPPSFGAAAGFKLARVKERIGYISDGRRLLLSRPLALPKPLNAEHRSHLYFNLLRRATGLDLDYVRPKIFLSEQDAARAGELLNGFGLKDSRSYVVMATRAVAESRRWGEKNYSELAIQLIKELDTAIVLIGAAEETESGNMVVEYLAEHHLSNGWAVNLAGKTTLRETAALMAGCQLFVGNDSGPAHLAAAVGVPLVVLSGADDPKETTPLSNRKELIYLKNLACISCVKNTCPLKGDDRMQCMKQITLPMVFGAAAKLLGC